MYEGWGNFTKKEIIENKKKVCIDCKYFTIAKTSKYANYGDSTCSYLDQHKHSRGCLPTECVEKGIFEPKKKKRKPKSIRIVPPWIGVK